MIQDFLHKIEQHFFREYPKEGCGLVGVQKGKAHWIPCENIAEINENFIEQYEEDMYDEYCKKRLH